MSNFSVGSFSSTGSTQLRGLSFTPNVPGPSGSGSPGSATTIYLTSIIVGSDSSTDTGEGPICYVYSSPLDDPADIGSSTGLVATSSSHSGNTTPFGNGTFATTYLFNRQQLQTSSKYYVYFSADKNVPINSDITYAGGSVYDVDLFELTIAGQFQANMSTT